MKNRKRVLVVGCVIFGLVLLFIAFRQNRLKSHGILLNAHTLEWGVSAKMGMDLQYEFYYNGKKIIDNNATGVFRGNRNFENKYFPVMYDPMFGASELLITPTDFEKYSIPFPDSLNWVLPYLK
jgi:hypothetical protein